MTAPRTRLLIADDEAALMKALCDTLRGEGYETVGVTSGEAALAALRESRFDLLLADLMMPRMDGIELLRAAFEIDPDLVGVIMTGEGTIATAVEAMKTGALDYILKPFKLSSILPVLGRALMVRRLRRERAELERSLRARTSELEAANRGLKLANHELDAANRELEAFTHTVSHDLRAPLRAIGGFSNLLRAEHAARLPPDAQQLLEHVLRNTEKMGRLIDGLLRLSQLGRKALERQPVRTAALVQEVLEEFADERERRQIAVRVGDLPDCTADSTLLKQVFVNLLGNAFKFTRQQPQPRVEVGARTQDGEQVFFVKDNGAGFDMQHAEKLFGVFQRLHRADEFEGCGIGLSIVQRIIERHGGRIWAEAEVNRGATFYFTLPVG